jgi:hypothetical protein
MHIKYCSLRLHFLEGKNCHTLVYSCLQDTTSLHFHSGMDLNMHLELQQFTKTYRMGSKSLVWKMESCRVWVNASQTTSHSFESSLSNKVCHVQTPSKYRKPKVSSTLTLISTEISNSPHSSAAAASGWVHEGDLVLGTMQRYLGKMHRFLGQCKETLEEWD